MSYEKEFHFDHKQIIRLEYSYEFDHLKVNNWTLFRDDISLVPDRETSEEIELLIAKFLEREYSRNDYNYQQDKVATILEKRYEGDR